MLIDISDYKKSISSIFEILTEVEINSSLDVAKDDPTRIALSDVYISAVKRCRQLLDVILKDE